MAPEFITEDFLLETEYARRLYHEYAADLPIIDFHCHLPPAEIAADLRWENMTRIWLAGDHYKWRAMRSNGVPERYCAGDASDREKFDQWAATMPYLVRNPLYDWSHLELARYFGISDRLLGSGTAADIWNECNSRLSKPEFSCRSLMKRSKVVFVCTTDDPTDTLEFHKAIAADKSFGVAVLPAWRPDKAMAVENPADYNRWIDKLEKVADLEIRDYETLMSALRRRQTFFDLVGCKLADHGMETVCAADYKIRDIDTIFRRVRAGSQLDSDEILKLRSAIFHELTVMNHEKGWTQQFHIGVIRGVNSRMLRTLGPDTGFDVCGDAPVAAPLAKALDRLEKSGQLARTIVYNINPCDNASLVTIIGAFQDGSTPGKIQFGSAWWFLDNRDGMERQLDDLSRNGLLRRFVGMVTDSRSFLSYTRHEYFRRLLCNRLGGDMARGRVPRDFDLLGATVRDVCYNNAAAYFGFDIPGRK